MKLKNLFAFIAVGLFLIGCSQNGDEGRELDKYVSSFLKDNNEVVAFGSVNLKGMLDKTGYEGNDKLQVLIGTELDKVTRVIDMNDPVFYALEGPFSEDGSPEKVHLFMKVHNQDSLIAELNGRSFDVEEADGISYTENGDFVLGIRNDLAIATIQGGDYEAKDVVKANFEKVDQDLSEGMVAEILASKGDMVIGLNLENLYGSSNTDLAKLDETKRKEIEAMVKGSFIQTNFRFKDGAAIMETKNLFSDQLMEKMFFRNDNSNTIFNKLNKGDGMILAAASVNLDVKKLETFMNEYSPGAMDGVTEQLGLGKGIMGLLGSEQVLSKLSDGQMGISLFGNPMENSFGVNTFFGTTDQGKMVFSMIQDGLPQGDYEYKEDGVYGNFDMSFGMGEETERQTMKLPKGCEAFGKKGFTAFLNFRDVDLEEFGFEGEMRLMEIVEYATLEYDNNGGKLYIKAKKGQENVLKQAMDIIMEDLTEQISKMAI